MKLHIVMSAAMAVKSLRWLLALGILFRCLNLRGVAGEW